MNRDDFFLLICGTSSSNDSIVSLLRARGFLIDATKGVFRLSDNSHIRDAEYLDSILNKYQLGSIKDGNLIFNDSNQDPFVLKQEFPEDYSIRFGVTTYSFYDWNWFKRRHHGEKVPVAELEPFIARYVKAISSCAVLTEGSCDGNHKQSNKMFLQLREKASILWHQLICELYISDLPIPWKKECQEISFTPETKYDVYFLVNKAAERLYEKRIEIRNIKESALQEISGAFIRHHSDSEIAELFKRRVYDLFNGTSMLHNNIQS